MQSTKGIVLHLLLIGPLCMLQCPLVIVLFDTGKYLQISNNLGSCSLLLHFLTSAPYDDCRKFELYVLSPRSSICRPLTHLLFLFFLCETK